MFKSRLLIESINYTQVFLINVSLFIFVDFLFQDMPESEKHKEEERLKEVEVKYQTYMEKIKEARCRAQKTFFVVTKLERLSLKSLSSIVHCNTPAC